MRLHRQLLLVSLLTLTLPWAGCEYVREMEKTLRDGQSAALRATAQAVAARLASDPETRQLITLASAGSLSGTTPVYAHPLVSAAIIDGYDDDWHGRDYQRQALPSQNDNFRVWLLAGRHGGELYLFARVEDSSPRHYSPMRDLAASDHLRLRLQPGSTPADFLLYTAAPGRLTVMDASGERQHRISGFWQEWERGYQVELRLPLNWAQEQLGLMFTNAGATQSQTLSNLSQSGEAPALITRSPKLDAALAVFTGPTGTGAPDILLRIASPQQWLIGEAGALAEPPPAKLEGEQILTRLYRLILGEQDFPSLPDPVGGGHFEQLDQSRVQTRWYESGNQQVARVSVPVASAETGAGSIATVVAEQSTDTLRAMTNSAFSRLVTYSLLAFGAAGLGLLSYASWLSWRIRRLSKATEKAVDANGRISGAFPTSRSGDEIGDLSRRYAELLQRLRHYNHYLETLASKLSHELRTPLAVVRSSLDNLEHEELPARAFTYSERARSGAERLSHILTAMSAASRVEQSIQSAELERADLAELLRDLSAAYADAYPQVHWRFHAPSARTSLDVAPELLVQMIDKLADNAADFCPYGETVEIALRAEDKALIIDISNPGPPLPEAMRGHLFDSLVSVREDSRKGQHLGLGLYIVRLIADFHGGTVTADNMPGDEGAVFSVRLPTAKD